MKPGETIEPVDELLNEVLDDGFSLASFFDEWVRHRREMVYMEEQMREWVLRHGHDPDTDGEVLPDGRRMRFVDDIPTMEPPV